MKNDSNGEDQDLRTSSLIQSYPKAATWLREVMGEPGGSLLLEALPKLFLLKYPPKLGDTTAGVDLSLLTVYPASSS